MCDPISPKPVNSQWIPQLIIPTEKAVNRRVRFGGRSPRLSGQSRVYVGAETQAGVSQSAIQHTVPQYTNQNMNGRHRPTRYTGLIIWLLLPRRHGWDFTLEWMASFRQAAMRANGFESGLVAIGYGASTLIGAAFWCIDRRFYSLCGQLLQQCDCLCIIYTILLDWWCHRRAGDDELNTNHLEILKFDGSIFQPLKMFRGSLFPA